MSFVIAPIVEGHGDVVALPVLLRRIAPSLPVKRPVRFPKSKLLSSDDLERAARIAASNIPEAGAILLVMDSDEECAASLRARLEEQLSRTSPNHLCRVVLAVHEFEAWIVGGDPRYQVEHPDAAGDLKGRIRRRFGVYSETADQARLVAGADLDLLGQRSRSFQRLLKVMRECLESASEWESRAGQSGAQ